MKKVTSIILLLLLCFTAYSQDDNKTEQRSDTAKIYFERDKHVINLDLGQNRKSLLHFSELVDKLNSDTLSTITKIEINSYASPEGGRLYNKKLSERRSNSIYDYLKNTMSVPENLLVKNFSGANWDGLQRLVEQSNMQYKDEILYILKNVPDETWRRVNPNDKWMTLVDSRTKHLKDLEYGNPYRDMYANFYPQLRHGSVVTIYFTREIPQIEETEVAVEPAAEPEPEVTSETETAPEPVVEVPSEPIIKPLLAIKTNLIYDAATALNIEFEVPIGDRWSIAAEWMFPWWTSCGNPDNSWQKNSERNSFEILNGNIEGKYWFGDRTNVPVLTGWHAGLYGGLGKYDLERNAKGYQGEFYTIGLSGGYAHTINKRGNLRMEYSIAVGYMGTNYRYYEEHYGIDDSWHTIRQNNGEYSWFGPTRLRASLVWMLNYKVNKEK